MDVVITPKGVAYKTNYYSQEDLDRGKEPRHKKVSEAWIDHFILVGLDTELPESTEDIMKDFDFWEKYPEENPGYTPSHLRQSLRRLFEAKLIEEYRG